MGLTIRDLDTDAAAGDVFHVEIDSDVRGSLSLNWSGRYPSV